MLLKLLSCNNSGEGDYIILGHNTSISDKIEKILILSHFLSGIFIFFANHINSDEYIICFSEAIYQ